MGLATLSCQLQFRSVGRVVICVRTSGVEHTPGLNVTARMRALIGSGAKCLLIDPVLTHEHLIDGLGRGIVDLAHEGGLFDGVALDMD